VIPIGALGGLHGSLMVCGTTSDAGKSFVVAGLCRLLARRGVAVAPFKAQNMALNAAVTGDGGEIGHAQWVQAVAAGVEPEVAMNPVLLKPTSDRTSQVVVLGRPAGVQTAGDYHRTKPTLLPVVLDALADLRRRFDVVICEGAGSPAEINLLERDIVNLPLARATGLPAIVVGDIDRGGVFASLYGTVALLPDDLRQVVRGFVVNKLRGDPALLGDACADLERRTGVPTLGVLPHVGVTDIDNEDSLALERADPEPVPGGDCTGDTLDVAAVRWPRVANAGDLDPLRLEPRVHVRWVRSAAELGRPDLVVLPGSKNTRGDLAWFRSTGLADAVAAGDAAVVAVCAGLQMAGDRIDDPDGVEGMPGTETGLGWLPVATEFRGDKVLDRPTGRAVGGPGAGRRVAGYRIHHGRVSASGPTAGADRRAGPWLVAADGADGNSADGEVLGWHSGRVVGTTLHGLFESDDFRGDTLRWVAARAGKHWMPGGVDVAAARLDRLDRIADTLEAHLDIDRVCALIAEASPT
jgi:adenosylcobyric acid synthase